MRVVAKPQCIHAQKSFSVPLALSKCTPTIKGQRALFSSRLSLERLRTPRHDPRLPQKCHND